jgi:hypothetical protein
MTPQHNMRIVLAVAMTAIVIGLLFWQNVRYRLVSGCHAGGGQWDGRNSRCRPVPKIYLERGLKRT